MNIILRQSGLLVARTLDTSNEGMALLPDLILTDDNYPEGFSDTFTVPATNNRIVVFNSECESTAVPCDVDCDCDYLNFETCINGFCVRQVPVLDPCEVIIWDHENCTHTIGQKFCLPNQDCWDGNCIPKGTKHCDVVRVDYPSGLANSTQSSPLYMPPYDSNNTPSQWYNYIQFYIKSAFWSRAGLSSSETFSIKVDGVEITTFTAYQSYESGYSSYFYYHSYWMNLSGTGLRRITIKHATFGVLCTYWINFSAGTGNYGYGYGNYGSSFGFDLEWM